MPHNKNRLVELFDAIDEKDTDSFLSFLGGQCVFRFGSLPSVSGRDDIGRFIDAFFDSIHSLKHEIEEYWSIPEGVVCHGTVTYTRHDQSVLSVPFANILKIEHGAIRDYRVFADTSQLSSS